MLRFSDQTLIEGHGSYHGVCEIMKKESSGDWMLESDTTVITPIISFDYRLHLWKNGEIYIMDTNHPTRIDVPDDDLRELQKWCEDNGWKKPTIHKSLLEDRLSFDFWMRMYQAGIVKSDLLSRRDADDMRRMSEITEEEDEEF